MDNYRNKFILYTAPNGEVMVEVYLEDETVWLTQKAMTVVKSTISEHLSNIYETNEIGKPATVRNFRTVQMECERSTIIN